MQEFKGYIKLVNNKEVANTIYYLLIAMFPFGMMFSVYYLGLIFSNKLKIHPKINSINVMINVPISICINKGISQVYFLFISPKSTKHIPPNINILQCEYPRQSISIKTYTMPPKENKKKYFKTLAIQYQSFQKI